MKHAAQIRRAKALKRKSRQKSRVNRAKNFTRNMPKRMVVPQTDTEAPDSLLRIDGVTPRPTQENDMSIANSPHVVCGNLGTFVFHCEPGESDNHLHAWKVNMNFSPHHYAFRHTDPNPSGSMTVALIAVQDNHDGTATEVLIFKADGGPPDEDTIKNAPRLTRPLSVSGTEPSLGGVFFDIYPMLRDNMARGIMDVNSHEVKNAKQNVQEFLNYTLLDSKFNVCYPIDTRQGYNIDPDRFAKKKAANPDSQAIKDAEEMMQSDGMEYREPTQHSWAQPAGHFALNSDCGHSWYIMYQKNDRQSDNPRVVGSWDIMVRSKQGHIMDLINDTSPGKHYGRIDIVSFPECGQVIEEVHFNPDIAAEMDAAGVQHRVKLPRRAFFGMEPLTGFSVEASKEFIYDLHCAQNLGKRIEPWFGYNNHGGVINSKLQQDMEDDAKDTVGSVN